MLRVTRVLLHSASKMTVNPPHEPLIAVIGTTGTGKSQLAVDLALRFNGEIINGDAVQMYEGLPIITNKITQDERKGVPHHLLGCIGKEEPTWSVDKFVRGALNAISDIRKRGRIPILVGGSHYYTQSLLFRGGRPDTAEKEDDENSEAGSDIDSADKWPILAASTEAMVSKLHEVDPVMATRWHPNDRRHIRRSLEIWLKTGRRASEIYAEQPENAAATKPATQSNTPPDTQTPLLDEQTPDDATASTLRFPTLILWTHASTAALHARLNERVHTMCRAGLLSEAQSLDAFAAQQEASGTRVDRTRGVFIAIGYRQFQPLITHIQQPNPDPSVTATLQAEAVNQTQAATRRYAKAQLRWLRIKLLHALRLAGPAAARSVYVLDAADAAPAAWDAHVLRPAVGLVDAFLAGRAMPDNVAASAAVEETLTPLREYDLARRRDLWQQRVCEACGVTAVTEGDWAQHVRGARHRKAMKKMRQREANETVVRDVGNIQDQENEVEKTQPPH